MSALVYVFGAMLAVGGLGMFGMTLYGMLPKAAQPMIHPPAPPAPGAPVAVLPSQKDYSVDEEEFRNWIEVRDALDPNDKASHDAHNAVLLALFGKHPEAPSVAKPA